MTTLARPSSFPCFPIARLNQGPKEVASKPATATLVSNWPSKLCYSIPVRIGRVLLKKNILQTIAAHLDVESLFNLGRTCRSLNDMVFTSYISEARPKEGYYGFSAHGTRYLSAPTFHPEGLLTAFRCSLAFHGSLKGIGFGFLPSHGFQGLLQDLSNLHTIIQYQPHKMGHVSLYFAQIDQATSQSSPAFRTGYRPTADLFCDRLCSVLDCVTMKGATLLDVEGGFDTLQYLLSSPPIPSQPKSFIGSPDAHVGPKSLVEESAPSMPSTSALNGSEGKPSAHGRRPSKMRNFFSGLLKGSSSDIQPVTTPPSSPQNKRRPLPGLLPRPLPFTTSPCLHDLRIRSDLLLSPLFLPWTINLLRSNASTLCILKFECTSTPKSTWHTAFSSVSLPNLRKLDISVAPLLVHRQLEIDPNDFALFFAQCPAIEEIILYGVQPAVPSPHVCGDLRLPRLTAFTGHPSDVSWILQLPQSSIPNLRRIVIATEYYTFTPRAPFDHSLVDNALGILATSPHELALGFRFKAEEGLDVWMRGRIKQAPHTPRLSTIRTLEIDFSWYMQFTNARLDLLCKFINTFPNVKTVILDQIKWPDAFGARKQDAEEAKTAWAQGLANAEKVIINGGSEIAVKTVDPLSRAPIRVNEAPPGAELMPGPPMA